jgi:aspartate aminotransferase-like enzyme
MAGPLLFTPGPVPIEKHLRTIGEQQPPYNRTEAFSAFTHEILAGLKYIFQTDGSVAMLTGSGTAAMEAAVLNFFGPEDKLLIINGGTFGQRWCELCDVHTITYDELPVPLGTDLDAANFDQLLSSGHYTAVLVNAHETSTGHLYDIQTLGNFTHRHGILFIVDAISTICADPFFMDAWHVDVAILSSQKALALPPGLSFVAMNQRAIDRLEHIRPASLYFNLKNYLTDQKRGQVPYTPAIGLLMQLHQRLKDIQRISLAVLVREHMQRADRFRKEISDLPFKVLPSRSSNAMTALSCDRLDAFNVVEELRDRFNIVVAPSGGPLKSKVFRVAHMGAQNDRDITRLIAALQELAAPDPHAITERVSI